MVESLDESPSSPTESLAGDVEVASASADVVSADPIVVVGLVVVVSSPSVVPGELVAIVDALPADESREPASAVVDPVEVVASVSTTPEAFVPDATPLESNPQLTTVLADNARPRRLRHLERSDAARQ